MYMVEKSWINVQQKTFTKWSVHLPEPACPRISVDIRANHPHVPNRLNDKLKIRNITIEDLVKDLCDGVSFLFFARLRFPREFPRRFVDSFVHTFRSSSSTCSRSSAESLWADTRRGRSCAYRSSKMSTRVSTSSRGGVYR